MAQKHISVSFETSVKHPEYGECWVRVKGNYWPLVRGVYGRMPEDCYPDEGDEFEFTKVEVIEVYDDECAAVDTERTKALKGALIDVASFSKNIITDFEEVGRDNLGDNY